LWIPGKEYLSVRILSSIHNVYPALGKSYLEVYGSKKGVSTFSGKVIIRSLSYKEQDKIIDEMLDRMVVEFYKALKFRMVILEEAEKYFLNRSKPGSVVF
jgi:hypothetical protein